MDGGKRNKDTKEGDTEHGNSSSIVDGGKRDKDESYSFGVGIGASDIDTKRKDVEHGNSSSIVDVGAEVSRRFMPVSQLTPYETGWTIKVHVTRKGILRTYAKTDGEGHVFHVELVDDDNMAIEACMFDDAAVWFFKIFSVGKTYEISKAKVHPANKKISRVKNDYELILNTNSIVKQLTEVNDDVESNLSGGCNFVRIDHLEPYINTKTLINVIGIVANVSSGTSIRRKANNQEVAKREVIIEDESGRSVRVSLWGDLALKTGALLAKIADQAPVVTLTSVKASDFLGVSLSTTSDTLIEINPSIGEAEALHSWYNTYGKSMRCAPAGANLPRRPVMLDPMTDQRFLSDLIYIHTQKIEYFNVR